MIQNKVAQHVQGLGKPLSSPVAQPQEISKFKPLRECFQWFQVSLYQQATRYTKCDESFWSLCIFQECVLEVGVSLDFSSKTKTSTSKSSSVVAQEVASTKSIASCDQEWTPATLRVAWVSSIIDNMSGPSEDTAVEVPSPSIGTRVGSNLRSVRAIFVQISHTDLDFAITRYSNRPPWYGRSSYLSGMNKPYTSQYL